MRNGQLDNVLRHIWSTAAARHIRELPDRELLERFVAGHDEVAFTALVERHGGLVLGVCRRILRNEKWAEMGYRELSPLIRDRFSRSHIPAWELTADYDAETLRPQRKKLPAAAWLEHWQWMYCHRHGEPGHVVR